MSRLVHINKTDQVKLSSEEEKQIKQLYRAYKDDKTVLEKDLDSKVQDDLIYKGLAERFDKFNTITHRGQKVANRL